MTKIRQLRTNEFPAGLREIPDPPERLFVRGVLPGPETKLLTVVGSRKVSDYGKQVCQKLISGLRGYDISIVSGLALGVDVLAHKTAIENGLHTIAVPGSGILDSYIYPRTNALVAKKILKHGGALLSEFEPNTIAALWTFPKRNRVMAGISHATLIIEATKKSGTLITARLTTDYNRELLIVPGSIFSPNSEGCHQFFKLGATPVFSSEDILEVLGFDPKKSKSTEHKHLSPEEKAVVEVLSIQPTPRDELIQKINLETNKANSLLTMMEIKDLIKESAGKYHLT